MGLKLTTSICKDMVFEEIVDFASRNGFESLDIACSPMWKSHMGMKEICHIDVENMNYSMAKTIIECCKQNGIKIDSLSYHPNQKYFEDNGYDEYIEYLYKMIDAAYLLGATSISTVITTYQNEYCYFNIKINSKTWCAVVLYAQEKGIVIKLVNKGDK